MARERRRRKLTVAARNAAREAAEIVAAVRVTKRTSSDLVLVSIAGRRMKVPAQALDSFADLLAALGDGLDVAVAPADIAVGTEEVARVLGISRRWAAELIDRGELTGTMTGSKRRVALSVLCSYRREQRSENWG